MIRLLDLLAVPDALAEHAVLVADAVAHDRQLQGGAAVQKTGGQTPEAAVAEAGVVFELDQLFQLDAKLGAARRATASVMPRFSMALPSVRPIRNSSDR